MLCEACLADSNFFSLWNIKLAAAEDSEYQLLIETIKKGFPNTRSMTDPKIRQYFSVKDRLSLIKYDIVVIDDRIVFPKSLRTTILKISSQCLVEWKEGLRIPCIGLAMMLTFTTQDIHANHAMRWHLVNLKGLSYKQHHHLTHFNLSVWNTSQLFTTLTWLL